MILEDINRQSLLYELESNYENKFYERFKSNDLNILYTITPINFEDRTICINEKLQKIIEKIFNNEKWGNSIGIKDSNMSNKLKVLGEESLIIVSDIQRPKKTCEGSKVAS